MAFPGGSAIWECIEGNDESPGKIFFEVRSRPGDANVAVSSAPSVFAAVEEQLGLTLESASASFDYFMIDSIERDPTDN